MVRTVARRGAVGAIAGLVAVAGLTTPAAHADAPDPFADTGTLTAWATGETPYGSDQVPAAYADQAISQISSGQGYTLTLDAHGTVGCFGESSASSVPEICDVPEAVNADGARSVAAGAFSNAGAVLEDGSVAVWGQSALKGAGSKDAPWPTNIPAELKTAGAAKQLSIGAANAAVVTSDGKVVAWGQTIDDTAVPAELKVAGSAKAVAVTAYGGVYVLKSDGAVTVFGAEDDVPSELTQAGAVKQLTPLFIGGSALTSGDEVVQWGTLNNSFSGSPQVPESLADETVTQLGGLWGASVAVTSDGDVVAWDCSGLEYSGTCPDLPASVKPADIAQVSSGGDAVQVVQRAVLPIAAPTVTGSAKVGATLTGTPGTFSGGGTVTNQWFAGEDPIDGATGTTFKPTSAQLGKTLRLTTTSTKGDVTRSQTSDATAAVAQRGATTVKATTTGSRYGASAPTVTVTLSPADATGPVHVAYGTTVVGSGTAAAGKATITLSSRTALPPGSRSLSVSYLGDDDHAAAKTSVKVTVSKAYGALSLRSATPTITAKKTKAKIVVAAKAAGTVPTGSVAIYLGKTKVGSGSLKAGRATVTVKAFPKAGKQILLVRYLGSSTVNVVSKRLTVTVKR